MMLTPAQVVPECEQHRKADGAEHDLQHDHRLQEIAFRIVKQRVAEQVHPRVRRRRHGQEDPRHERMDDAAALCHEIDDVYECAGGFYSYQSPEDLDDEPDDAGQHGLVVVHRDLHALAEPEEHLDESPEGHDADAAEVHDQHDHDIAARVECLHDTHRRKAGDGQRRGGDECHIYQLDLPVAAVEQRKAEQHCRSGQCQQIVDEYPALRTHFV